MSSPGVVTTPGTVVPPPPGYGGSAAPVPTSTSSKNPSDIWGLGDVYGQPVYLGESQSQAPVEDRGGIRPGGPTRTVSHPSYGTTQDIMEQAVHLWSAQASERKKNPDTLTGYEQLQRALYSAGFYGQTAFDKIHVGQWTTQTQAALSAALGQYETARTGGQMPVTFSEFLQGNAAQNGDGGIMAGGAGGGAAAPQVQLADPNTIRAAAQQAAQEALGQGLSTDQLDKFVAQFQAAQTSAQTSTASSVTGPDLSGDAMAFAQSSNPGEFRDTQRQAYVNTLVNMFAPSASQRPGMTPVPSVK